MKINFVPGKKCLIFWHPTEFFKKYIRIVYKNLTLISLDEMFLFLLPNTFPGNSFKTFGVKFYLTTI